MLTDKHMKIVDNWSFKWSIQLRQEFRKLVDRFDIYLSNINDVESIDNLISDFIDRINDLVATLTFDQKKKFLSEDTLISGAGCFYFSVLISYIHYGEIRNIDALFNFASLYMLLDYFLDDSSISTKTKKSVVKILNQAMDNPFDSVEPVSIDMGSDTSNQHSLVKKMITILRKILQDVPSSHKYLREVYYAEILSSKIQYVHGLSRPIYHHASVWKGGATTQAIQSILKLPVTDDEYNLGATIQLVDDIYDVEKDIEEEINTAATWDLETHGNLDSIVTECIESINNLSSKYSIMKVVLMNMLMYGIASRGESLFSKTLIVQLNKYLLVNSNEYLRGYLHRYFLKYIKLM